MSDLAHGTPTAWLQRPNPVPHKASEALSAYPARLVHLPGSQDSLTENRGLSPVYPLLGSLLLS
jgi:hypothetical protein